jgi:hypothetical protein
MILIKNDPSIVIPTVSTGDYEKQYAEELIDVRAQLDNIVAEALAEYATLTTDKTASPGSTSD